MQVPQYFFEILNFGAKQDLKFGFGFEVLNIPRVWAPAPPREVLTKIVSALTPRIYQRSPRRFLPHLNPSRRPAIRRHPSPTSPSHGAPGLRLRRRPRSRRQDPPPPSLPRCRRLSLRAPRPRSGTGGFAGRRVVIQDHHRRRLAPPPFLIPQADAPAHRAGPAAAFGAPRGAAVARLVARDAPGGAERAALVTASTVRFVSSSSSFACLRCSCSAAQSVFMPL